MISDLRKNKGTGGTGTGGTGTGGTGFSGKYSDLTGAPDLTKKLNVSDTPGAVTQTALNVLLEPIVENYININAEAWYDISLPVQGSNVDWNVADDKITKIYDKTLSQSHATQSNAAIQSSMVASKQNKRRYFEFTGSNRYVTDINLNFENTCCVIVQKLSAAIPSGVSNGIFGHDNGGWDRFAYYINGNLGLGGSTIQPQYFVGQPKADPADLNINCLSVGWYGRGADESELWCNGKMLNTFTGSGNVGSTQMTLGDLAPNGVVAFNGNIYEFIVFKKKVSKDRMRQIHEFLRRKWGITTWDAVDLTLTGS